MAIKALIFDFDGLILDTEVPLFNVYRDLFNQHGFPYTYRNWWNTIGAGPSGDDPAVDLAELINEPEKANSFRDYAEKTAKEMIKKLPALPGVPEFIQKAYELNIKMTVASSSSRDWVESLLNHLSLRHYFDFVLTSNDVQKVKPNPDLYLLALEKLGITSKEAIVFEDSPNGIKAAKAAGLYCVAVPNDITREMPIQIADLIVDSFLDLSPAELLNEKIISS